MMKENRIVVKAPFKERWEAFKKAYFEWARYNPYKEDPLPNRNEIWRRLAEDVVMPTDIVKELRVTGLIAGKRDLIYKEECKIRKKRVKFKKKTLRRRLKDSFIDLF